jgi:hypothetical protein
LGFFFAAATQKTQPLERSLYERANGYSYDAVKIYALLETEANRWVAHEAD